MSTKRRFHCIIKYKTLIKTRQFDLIKDISQNPLKVTETEIIWFLENKFNYNEHDFQQRENKKF